MPHPCCLPSRQLSAVQADWLRPARSRLLRRADIAHRHRVLDLGAGWGLVSEELQQRAASRVVAVDCRPIVCEAAARSGCDRVLGDAQQLPFADGSFDLVFVQCAFLWFALPRQVVAEIIRVLQPGGMIAAIEPDYGGLMEFPSDIALQDVWLAALERAGADPWVGRKLPAWFAQAGFRVETRFLDRLETAAEQRFDLLAELPLTRSERERVDAVRVDWRQYAQRAVVHLPFWLVLGEKPKL